jgi:hypothetical protein
VESLKSSLKGALEAELEGIPQFFRHGPVIHQTIKCFLYAMVKEADLWPIPDFKPPRMRDGGFIDIIGVDPSNAVKCAFAVGPVVELKAVKSLDALEVEEKWIITYSTLAKKVKESTFFLKPSIEHLHLDQK